jgi:hypothetical protein
MRKKFRRGLVLGAGVGYVLGTKAGRERYEQLRGMWAKLTRTDPGRRVETTIRDTVGQLRPSKAGPPGSERAGAPLGYEAELASLRGPGAEA